MSGLADRLRTVIGPSATNAAPLADVRSSGPSGPLKPSGPRPSFERTTDDHAADTLGGEWREIDGCRFLVIDRRYAPGHRHGHVTVCDAAPGESAWSTLHLLDRPAKASAMLAEAPQPAPAYPSVKKLLFVDLETTGLAGGAGTYAFLVGCGWFDGATFRIRQFFLASFAAEPRLLQAVAQLAEDANVVVTYNGKTFDLPLIETRYVLHRLSTPFAEVPHVDMLHPARRLWRSGDQEGCRLADLEETLLGHEREGDVPGFEIPARYFAYVHSGDVRGLEPVLEHNRLDLLSLAFVTARATQLLDEGPAAARTAREACGMGRLYERAGRLADASACYARGAELPGDAAAVAENLRASAVLARRARRFADAADAWRRILALRGCPSRFTREAAEALAVHNEHRVRSLDVARQFAMQALALQSTASQRHAVHHRLARLDRKLGLETLF